MEQGESHPQIVELRLLHDFFHRHQSPGTAALASFSFL
jgi:hypothetical protein